MVTSKPKRISVTSGLLHIKYLLIRINLYYINTYRNLHNNQLRKIIKLY